MFYLGVFKRDFKIFSNLILLISISGHLKDIISRDSFHGEESKVPSVKLL